MGTFGLTWSTPFDEEVNSVFFTGARMFTVRAPAYFSAAPFGGKAEKRTTGHKAGRSF
jgi:hypothetical protein